MLELDVVQAAYGDCLILRYATTRTRRTILIDGGPSGTYEAHLRGLLEKMAANELQLDLVVLSHIDNDHVKGLLDLFAELNDDDQDGADSGRRLPSIFELWHNSFSVSAGGADLAPRIREALTLAGPSARAMRGLTGTLMGVAEGDALHFAAQALGVPINRPFPAGSVMLDDAPTVRVGGMRVEVVGPSKAILEKLRQTWLVWLERHGRATPAQWRALATAADRSIPNLSSIVLLVHARGRKLLLTGDGRADHILDGLGERGLLDESGSLHVDLLKLPHHGSSRNASEEFFRRVTADCYVVSANGRYGNPDLTCLLWLVDSAQGRPFELVVTNDAPAIAELTAMRPPADHGYRLTVADPEAHAHTVVLE